MEDLKELALIKRQPTYKLIIPIGVENKIRHLCQRVPNVEWSGTLFFTHEGSMEEGNLVITCKDIFVMDIGSAAYTEFDMSPEVISYMCDHPELLDMQMGLIHSHNNMATFFSGTDTATLKEEGRDRNHFVSLIVNNAGTYTAAVTRKIKSTRTVQESYSYGTFNDETVSSTREYTEEVETIEYFDLDITKEGIPTSFEDLDKRLEEIRKRKATPTQKTSITTAYRPQEVKRMGETPSLFSREDFMESEPPRMIRHIDEDEIPFEMVPVNEKDVQHVLLQLVTGSIILRDTSKIDVKRWVNSMPQVFGERFGVDEEGIKEYERWVDWYCEFLIFDKEPDDLSAQDEASWMASFSLALYDELDALPQNRYIEILKGIVEQWIV